MTVPQSNLVFAESASWFESNRAYQLRAPDDLVIRGFCLAGDNAGVHLKDSGPVSAYLDGLPPPQAEDVVAFLEHLECGGLREALHHLSRSTPHRFTGVFRFDGTMLRSVELVDKWSPGVVKGEDIPIASAYCAHLHDTGEPLEVTDGVTDARTPWMAQSGMRSYCGALIRDHEGMPWGAICHYDASPCEATSSRLPVLVAAAALLYESASGR